MLKQYFLMLNNTLMRFFAYKMLQRDKVIKVHLQLFCYIKLSKSKC